MYLLGLVQKFYRVELGSWTIVGTGAVVTKSFPSGFVMIAGNPARIIKHYNKNTGEWVAP